jgi:tripartite-type tricarboxylate transporter receptor subunit TctC
VHWDHRLFAGAAQAASLIHRPVQIIVPFPPGGVADLVGRPFAAALEKLLKQPFVIVNKTGAGGAVGHQAQAVAKPDGYTLMVALSSISFMPEVDSMFGRPLAYKLTDFAPIALLSSDPTIMVVKANSPWKTLADFVADAKKRPGQIKYSSSGVYGTLHVATEMFAHDAGIKLRHIPTGGRRAGSERALETVDTTSAAPTCIPQIKAGRYGLWRWDKRLSRDVQRQRTRV